MHDRFYLAILGKLRGDLLLGSFGMVCNLLGGSWRVINYEV